MPVSSRKPTPRLAAVRRDELLPIAVVQERLGIGPAAIRAARRRGLVVKKIGTRSIISGDDLHRYFDEQARSV
jgi:hypothetical protein